MSEALVAPVNHEDAPLSDEQEYRLLVGHRRTDGSFKSTETLQTEYLTLTDNIVYQCTDGVDVEDRATGEQVHAKPDYVIFLDKSARPVAWLFNEAWPVLAQNEDGSVPEPPQTKFLNIDRLHWINTVDPEGKGLVEASRVDPSVIRSLRSIFLKPTLPMIHHKKKQGLTPELDDVPTIFDPVIDPETKERKEQTILVVDEVRSTGRTLQIACDMLARAFPETRIAGTHWMSGTAIIGQAVGNADLPVWYHKDKVYGRGVGDRNPALSSASKSVTQRLGGLFLSTILPHPEKTPHPDEEGRQIRRELHQLVRDLQARRVRFVPSVRRPDGDQNDARTLRLNGVSSFAEFRKKWPIR